MSSDRKKRVLACVLLSPTLAVAVALALRLVLLWLSHRGENLANPRFETVGLETKLVAESLAAGNGFFGPYPGYELPTACLAPVYPFLWAIGIKIFHLNSFGATILSQAMNSVFASATCWPIFGIGKRVFSRRIGLSSAWLWVVLPYAVLLPLEWMWDQSLSALMLAIIVWATFRLSESVSSLSLTIYGLLWGLAALVNPTLCVMLPFLLGWVIFRRGQTGWISLAAAAKVIFVFVLVLTPWSIRNYYAIDGLVFVKSNFGMEFWLGNNPGVKEIYTPERHPASNPRELIALALSGEPNYNRAKERQAIAYIKAYPRAFERNSLARIEDTWSASYDSRVEPWILALHASQLDVWFCSLFSALSFIGMFLALRSNWKEAFPLAMCLVVFPVPYYITHTAIRYRHPIDPMMTILTVYTISSLYTAISMHKVWKSIKQ